MKEPYPYHISDTFDIHKSEILDKVKAHSKTHPGTPILSCPTCIGLEYERTHKDKPSKKRELPEKMGSVSNWQDDYKAVLDKLIGHYNSLIDYLGEDK